jgi:IclR family transcriptional regulator, acetate operon repressor
MWIRSSTFVPERSGSVQSIERAFGLLEVMASSGGIAGLSELSQRSGLAVPTIHRLLRTLVELGYVRQEPSRKYALGPRLVALGDSASRLVGARATPHLARLTEELGESANLALLDGHEVLYVAQAPGQHEMRMITEVGRRAPAHCTAVGKAILAGLPEARVDAILAAAGMEARTPNTLVTPAALKHDLEAVRSRGYALDEQEQELGVRCVGVALPGEPPRAAISVSGPIGRMTDALVTRATAGLQTVAAELAADFALSA